jgi:hypothetical protein
MGQYIIRVAPGGEVSHVLQSDRRGQPFREELFSRDKRKNLTQIRTPARSLADIWEQAFVAAKRAVNQTLSRAYADYYLLLVRRLGRVRPYWPCHAAFVLADWLQHHRPHVGTGLPSARPAHNKIKRNQLRRSMKKLRDRLRQGPETFTCSGLEHGPEQPDPRPAAA